MKIFQGIDQLSKIPKPVLTIGTFDGVHLGHQKIIENLNRRAEEQGGESVLFTFYPHPRMVIYPDSHGVQLIQTQEEKLYKLEKIGLKNCIVYPFTYEFSRLSALEFVRDFLVNKIDVEEVVIGYDHQFGKNREGSISFLKEASNTYGFKVTEISAEEINEVNVSSTKIRKALKSGNITTANAYLGDTFELNGKIKKGKGIGRTINYPTANVQIENSVKLIPANGVYVVKCIVKNKEYVGMLNIGVNPTVSNSNKKSIEVHLLDFSENVYGEHIAIHLWKRIREEKKFDTIDELQKQIQLDETFTRNFMVHSSMF